MNSLIIHDSVQAAIWEYFGIDFDETGLCNSNVNIMENYIEDEGLRLLEDDAFAHYDEIMATYYSDYVKVDTTLNNEILMSPLGILDEQVFCNTHNLYICEGMVVKYLSDGHFSCPIDEYEYYENKISVYDIDVSDPHSRIRVSPSAPNDVTFDSNNSIDYKTEVNFHISVTSSWFGLERKCTSMCATNYHRNANGNYRRVACETKIIADVGVQCNAGTWDYHFRTGWCPMGGGMIYYRIKYTDCGCHNTHFSYIALECRNQHGVVINEHL